MPMPLNRALGLVTSQAESLPLPPPLVPLRIKMRPANLVMVAGRPGAGKSMLVDWLVRWMVRNAGLSALFFSADMNEFDTYVRAAAGETGHTTDMVEHGLKGGGAGYYEEVLDDLGVQYCFDSSLTLDDIAEELDAYVEVNDAFPDVVVIDHLNKLHGSEEYQGQKWLLSELHTLAHNTQMLVIVIHHARTTDQKNLTMPAPASGIENRMTHYPELVLTGALDQVAQIFRLACVKQRGGPDDESGQSYIELSADPARCSYGVPRPAAVANYWSEVE